MKTFVLLLSVLYSFGLATAQACCGFGCGPQSCPTPHPQSGDTVVGAIDFSVPVENDCNGILASDPVVVSQLGNSDAAAQASASQQCGQALQATRLTPFDTQVTCSFANDQFYINISHSANFKCE